MRIWLNTTWRSKCTEWKVYQGGSIPRRWFTLAPAGTREAIVLLTIPWCWKWWDLWLCLPLHRRGLCLGHSDHSSPSMAALSQLADNGVTALAESCHGRMWAYHLWARTTLLETMTIRSETLLGLCDEGGSQCGQQISKTICFWQCVLFHRWTVTFCSLWNIFNMHDFLS